MTGRANVIGAGPNGVAAAIVLAQAGFEVHVYEAEPEPGGAARTLPLTLPGFLHDFGSAVHPMAIGSPFFRSLPLEQYGLEWIHPSAPLAHPLDDGTAVMLERSFDTTAANLRSDGQAWKRLFSPIADHWTELAPDLLGPINLIPRHPLRMGRLGVRALPPAHWLANHEFRGMRAKALFAGLAAHSVLSLYEVLSSAFGLILGATAHAVGWPIPRGGAGAITNALCRRLESVGGKIHVSYPVRSLHDLPAVSLTICDLTPRQVLDIAGDRLTPEYRRRMQRWRYGPGVFKVDYALSEPIPWKSADCRRSATVHIGGTLEEIAESEAAMRAGKHAGRPFVLLAQPTLFDPSRAPEGRHTAWAYCHVPNGSDFNMLPRLESQIERFAPGFRDCILATQVFTPAALHARDANLVGGDIGGGAIDLQQFLFRPTGKYYATSAPDIYICSSSTPPGGGVHGMCGFHAATMALRRLRRQ
ncbi:MAG: FAD-dependent oxidoreductase [Proteobacteria bacterium]|nr:MAG: FAD-dependent oxidoreductase [Pseudomonadota bacterium]